MMWCGLVTAVEEAYAQEEQVKDSIKELALIRKERRAGDQLAAHLKLLQTESSRMIAQLCDPSARHRLTVSSVCFAEQTLFAMLGDLRSLQSSSPATPNVPLTP